MTTKLNKLRTLLRELFQLDQADLDFGIYRIMNQKREDVERFLDKDLLPQVRDAFEKYRPADKATLQTELDKLVAGINAAGMSPEESPKVQELRQRLAKGVDVAALEAEVFSDLFTFFRRYYNGGDFLSLRRYKEGVYAIPYEGEEVKLHWANHDQYYIKSSEHLTNYAFKAGEHRVRFELVAASVEQDNNKAQNGSERRFIVADDEPVVEDGGDLLVRFEYRPDPAKRSQDALNAETASVVLAAAPTAWKGALNREVPTEANPSRTVFDQHLRNYTARNTFDYFVHKDLGGFLRRELDFFIKNEILILDDIDQVADFTKVEEKLSKIRVLRAIAQKIIAFLAQLEDFQKKLWLKKKFVVETNWCISLDRIAEEFYPEIAANEKQREEWVRLIGIDAIEGDIVEVGYSVPLSVEFLKSHTALVIDTRCFPDEFTSRLLESQAGEIDELCDGLLFHGENSQVMALALERHRAGVDCIYIDPPYNTGRDGFAYKDAYQHSSWLAMMDARLEQGHSFLSPGGILLSSINDTEHTALGRLLASVFGSENHVGTMVWKGSTDNNPTRIAVEHEYVLCYARAKEQATRHWSTSTNEMKQLMLDTFGRCKESSKTQAELASLFDDFTATRRDELGDLYRYRHVDHSGPYVSRRNMENPGKPGYDYDIPHPKTGKPCARPYWGWRFPPATIERLLAEGRIIFGDNEDKIPELKVYLRDVTFPLRSVFSLDARKGSNELDRLFGSRDVFKNPKPAELLEHLLPFATAQGGTVLDFFAGSGTTGQAVIRLNREDGGGRRFFLIEMGDHFDQILLPRIKKCMSSPEWKGGAPQRLATAEERKRAPRMLKVVRLESYDDVLDNLELRTRTGPQQQLLSASTETREDYMLSYMLDIETEGSTSLLNTDQFRDPFAYKLKVTRNNETRLATVDLVETFNYLIGMRVDHMAARVHRGAEFKRDEHGRLQVKGKTKPCDAGTGWSFRAIQGKSPHGERVLVVWRVLTDDPEKDNLMLDTFCKKMGFSTKDMEFDLIYVNGDNNLENLRRDEDTWKVQLIEESFHRHMFDLRGA